MGRERLVLTPVKGDRFRDNRGWGSKRIKPPGSARKYSASLKQSLHGKGGC